MKYIAFGFLLLCLTDISSAEVLLLQDNRFIQDVEIIGNRHGQIELTTLGNVYVIPEELVVGVAEEPPAGAENLTTQELQPYLKPAYGSEVLPGRRLGRPRSALCQNDILLLLDGGLVLAAGKIFDLEKSSNPVYGWAIYEDGTVKESELTHSNTRYGGLVEYLISDQFGLQLGYLYHSFTQEVSVGGGQYEKKTFAKGNLLTYGLPFAGGTFYFLNAPEVTLSLIGRVGTVIGGTLSPQVTAFDYFGFTPAEFNVTGFVFGAGLGLQYIAYGHLVLGGSVLVNQHRLHASEKVYFDLPQDFEVTSVDLNLALGVKF